MHLFSVIINILSELESSTTEGDSPVRYDVYTVEINV